MLDGYLDFDSVGTLFVIAFILAMTTCGTILLVHLIAPKARRARKTLIGAVLGPNSVPVAFILVATTSGDRAAAVVVMILMMSIFSLLIGWPIAHFSNKRLERLVLPDAEIFE